jgi:hypothetical protein
MKKYPKFKAAAMHVSPVFLDTEKTDIRHSERRVQKRWPDRTDKNHKNG